jgi:hypothetical protein
MCILTCIPLQDALLPEDAYVSLVPVAYQNPSLLLSPYRVGSLFHSQRLGLGLGLGENRGRVVSVGNRIHLGEWKRVVVVIR